VKRRKHGHKKPGRQLQLGAEARAVLERQLQRFREKFGREPGPSDPIFFDPDADTPQPISGQKQRQWTADIARTMAQAGLPPDKIYAYIRTGLMPTEDNWSQIPPHDRKAWNNAIEEHRALAHHKAAGQDVATLVKQLVARLVESGSADWAHVEEIRNTILSALELSGLASSEVAASPPSHSDEVTDAEAGPDPLPMPPFPEPDNEVFRLLVQNALEEYNAGRVTVEQAVLHAAVHAWYEGHIQGEDACPGCEYRGQLPKQTLRGWLPPGSTTN
jgi:hypothetical protein